MKYPSKINSTYRSSFHTGAGKKRGNGNCLATLWPNFTLRLKVNSFFSAGETRVEKRDRVEYTDSSVGTEAEADNVMIQIKPYLFNM